MNMETLVSRFSSLYGVDVNTESGLAIIQKCIQKISEEYPKRRNVNIMTIAGQEEYKLDMEEFSDLIRVSKVFYSRQHMNNNSEDVSFGGMPRTFGYSLSKQFTEIMEDEFYNKMNQVDVEITDFNSFNLIPPPEITGVTIPVECEFYRTIEEIPVIFEDSFFKLYFYYQREESFRESLSANNGNVYRFDRKGNINAEDTKNEAIEREKEFKTIVKEIRQIALRLRA